MPREADEQPGQKSAPTREDRKRVEHMLRCSLDARIIVHADEAAEIARDMVRTRALVNCFTEMSRLRKQSTTLFALTKRTKD